jgi:predicted regulator of Ras-like GTPase activity (Roadblock/LC7/MglB family)
MQTITQILQKLAAFDGVQGCALVEADTGMVWHYAGPMADMEHVGEAAVEFWRTQNRVAAQLGMMGPLKFASYNYGQRMIGLIPCDPDLSLVLVCVAISPGMAWNTWMKELPALRNAVKQFNAKQTTLSAV